MTTDDKATKILLGMFEKVMQDEPRFNEKGRDLDAACRLANICALLTSMNKDEREMGKKQIRQLIALHLKAIEAKALAKAANRFEP